MITIGNGPTVHLGIGRRLSSRFFQQGRAPAENLVRLTFQLVLNRGQSQGSKDSHNLDKFLGSIPGGLCRNQEGNQIAVTVTLADGRQGPALLRPVQLP